jgi:hypothetical protein
LSLCGDESCEEGQREEHRRGVREYFHGLAIEADCP